MEALEHAAISHTQIATKSRVPWVCTRFLGATLYWPNSDKLTLVHPRIRIYSPRLTLEAQRFSPES